VQPPESKGRKKKEEEKEKEEQEGEGGGGRRGGVARCSRRFMTDGTNYEGVRGARETQAKRPKKNVTGNRLSTNYAH